MNFKERLAAHRNPIGKEFRCVGNGEYLTGICTRASDDAYWIEINGKSLCFSDYLCQRTYSESFLAKPVEPVEEVEEVETIKVTSVKALSKLETSLIGGHFALTAFWIENLEVGLISEDECYEELFS